MKLETHCLEGKNVIDESCHLVIIVTLCNKFLPHFVRPVAPYNNFLSRFVTPVTLCNNFLSQL